jgi:effector-binding domain-containing protein
VNTAVMRVQPTIAKREAQRYAGIRKVLRREEIPDVVPDCLATVIEFLQKHRVQVIGAPLIRYFRVDYNNGGIEVDVGVPVGVTLPANPRVHSAQIPSGTFATVVHQGPYDALVETTAALMDWAKQNKVNWMMAEQHRVTRWDGRVEHYLVGPPDEPTPKNWQTEIAILISDAHR